MLLCYSFLSSSYILIIFFFLFFFLYFSLVLLSFSFSFLKQVSLHLRQAEDKILPIDSRQMDWRTRSSAFGVHRPTQYYQVRSPRGVTLILGLVVSAFRTRAQHYLLRRQQVWGQQQHHCHHPFDASMFWKQSSQQHEPFQRETRVLGNFDHDRGILVLFHGRHCIQTVRHRTH